MADEDSTPQGDGESREVHQPEIQMELVGSLPGGRAVAGVEQEGSIVLLASREHISEQASGELTDVFQRIVREGWWPRSRPTSN